MSTPLVFSGGTVIANFTRNIHTDPSTGNFSILLEPGNYTVIYKTPTPTQFTISVPSGNSTMDISEVVSTPLAFVFTPPNTVWNGTRAGHITFLPTPAPVVPTNAVIAYAGGNVNAAGGEKFSYFISYVTATGETNVSPVLNVAEAGGANANKANRISFASGISGVTSVNIWRTYVDTGSTYDMATFPTNVGLLATVVPTANFYDDWESTSQFAGRVTAQQPIIYNSTSGQILSSLGNPVAIFSDAAIYYIGTNCRIKNGVGIQIWNFDAMAWFTLLNVNVNGVPVWSMDAGNPN